MNDFVSSIPIEFNIENFSGPLELLLDLIKKNKMDIYKVKVSEITKQYIDYLQQLKEKNINISSEFLIMASYLLRLKTRMILSAKEEEEEEISLELVNLLLEYKKYREAIIHFEKLEQQRLGIQYRNAFLPKEFKIKDIRYKQVEIEQLINALEIVSENLKGRKIIEKQVSGPKFTIDECVNFILQKLQDNEPLNLFDLFKQTGTKEELIAKFLACLELAYKQKILILQSMEDDNIYIYRRHRSLNDDFDKTSVLPGDTLLDLKE